MEKIKNIAVVCNPEKPKAKKMAEAIRRWLSSKPEGYKVYATLSWKALKKADVVIGFGGDGWLLRIARLLFRNGKKTPIVMINFGTEGYLCRIQPDLNEVKERIGQILKGNFEKEERTRIQAEIFRKTETGDKSIVTIDALNEIVIAGGPAKMVSLAVTIIDGEEVITEDDPNRCDGIIFCTKTGSPAYNYNAGGIVIEDGDSDGFVITALIPMRKDAPDSWLTSERTAKFSTETIFKIRSRTKKKANLPSVVGDGQDHHKMGSDEYVVIKKSPWKTWLVEFEKQEQ